MFQTVSLCFPLSFVLLKCSQLTHALLRHIWKYRKTKCKPSFTELCTVIDDPSSLKEEDVLKTKENDVWQIKLTFDYLFFAFDFVDSVWSFVFSSPSQQPKTSRHREFLMNLGTYFFVLKYCQLFHSKTFFCIKNENKNFGKGI